MSYAEFLARKQVAHVATGIADPPGLSPKLKDFQSHVTRWALQRGRAAAFLDCGLGKSWIALEWAQKVVRHTNKPVLILTPLAVAQQFVREGVKLGVSVGLALEGLPQREWWCPDVWVANYESLHKLEAMIPQLGGVVLDESSILKSFTGKTRNALVESFRGTPFRLACTATPSPNDPVELGNHAEFLGVMRHVDMLNRFFEHDAGDTGTWVLKGHARKAFWQWVASWAVAMNTPSDLGYSDEGYDLPPLQLHEHVIDVDQQMARKAGMLFAFEASSLTEQREVRKSSIDQRVAKVAELVNSTTEQWLVFCDLNPESEALAAAIPDAIEVTGSDSAEFKEAAIAAFTGETCRCQAMTQRSNRKGASTVTPRSSSRQVAGHGSTDSASIAIDPAHRFTESDCGTLSSRRPRSAASISGSGTREIRNGCGSTEEQTVRRLTPPSEPSTGMTLRIESGANSSRRSGSKGTQGESSISSSTSTASPSTSTIDCSVSRAEGAPSVGRKRTKAKSAQKDSTSTTATPRESSEDCSATTATTESGSSRTNHQGSSERRCTCGGLPVRVIVSKASIYGWGVNLQCASHIVFVGSDWSFEKFYQAVRRSWRFGQSRPVHAHMIRASADGRIVDGMRRKQEEHQRMHRELADAINRRECA